LAAGRKAKSRGVVCFFFVKRPSAGEEQKLLGISKKPAGAKRVRKRARPVSTPHFVGPACSTPPPPPPYLPPWETAGAPIKFPPRLGPIAPEKTTGVLFRRTGWGLPERASTQCPPFNQRVRHPIYGTRKRRMNEKKNPKPRKTNGLPRGPRAAGRNPPWALFPKAGKLGGWRKRAARLKASTYPSAPPPWPEGRFAPARKKQKGGGGEIGPRTREEKPGPRARGFWRSHKPKTVKPSHTNPTVTNGRTSGDLAP